MTRSPTTRRPAVAGLFYPADPGRLRRSIDEAVADAVQPVGPSVRPRALVVPHAGYPYSGPIAASAYLRLVPHRAEIRRVVLFGPSHRVPLRGLAVPTVDQFDGPLGSVTVDDALRRTVLGLPHVAADDLAHRDEHSLEVQLPFLQTVLDEFTLLPIVVGDAETDEVAAVVAAVWDLPDVLVVVSTDLSHYHPYDEARELDARTAATVVACDPSAVGDRDACGARPLRGLLRVVGDRRAHVEQLDLRNSGDTAGDRDRVVGYGAFAVV